ncbi:hypothetical protein TSUD_147190 [Trifolium subterraneum]|uniref:Uncharacterized protein n=1 Tax=Trifolium subterraneum TaxID=3900 RepID=A0A2Z6MUZ4_TRISU|nr:hypothetical protein TSUD_147190 [Trifolium subterraneum]
MAEKEREVKVESWAAFYSSKGNKRRDGPKSKCEHCRKSGHVKAGCFEIIGYPANWETRRTQYRQLRQGEQSSAHMARVEEGIKKENAETSNLGRALYGMHKGYSNMADDKEEIEEASVYDISNEAIHNLKDAGGEEIEEIEVETQAVHEEIEREDSSGEEMEVQIEEETQNVLEEMELPPRTRQPSTRLKDLSELGRLEIETRRKIEDIPIEGGVNDGEMRSGQQREVVTQTIDDMTSDDGGEIIMVPTTQVNVVLDEEFNEQVQNELRVVKQLWADMADQEKPFTPVVLKRN